jgi:hypothetical protein
MTTDPAREEVLIAIRRTPEYVSAAFGVPPEARESYASALAAAACSVLVPMYTKAVAAMGESAASWKQRAQRLLTERDGARADRDQARAQLAAVRDVLERVQHVMTTSATDWSAHNAEAQLWGVFVGWECDAVDPDGDPVCEDPGGHDRCDESLMIMRRRFGWSDAQIAVLRRYRGVIRRLLS